MGHPTPGLSQCLLSFQVSGNTEIAKFSFGVQYHYQRYPLRVLSSPSSFSLASGLLTREVPLPLLSTVAFIRAIRARSPQRCPLNLTYPLTTTQSFPMSDERNRGILPERYPLKYIRGSGPKHYGSDNRPIPALPLSVASENHHPKEHS
jgi:hypothetical protein